MTYLVLCLQVSQFLGVVREVNLAFKMLRTGLNTIFYIGEKNITIYYIVQKKISTWREYGLVVHSTEK